MKTVTAVMCFVLAACSLQTKEMAFIPAPIPEAEKKKKIDDATESYRQFLQFLDYDYLESVDPNRVTFWAIRGAMARLNSHGGVISRDEINPNCSEKGIGVSIGKDWHGSIVIASIAPQSPAEREDLRPGDRIIAVDNEAVLWYGHDEAAILIACGTSQTVSLTILRDSSVLTKILSKQKNIFRDVVTETFPDNIAYIYITHLGTYNIVGEILGKIRNLCKNKDTRFILDLRAMRGGFVYAARKILGAFLPSGMPIVYYNETPLEVPEGAVPIENTLVVLVNQNTVSAGEMIALALKETGRALVIGERTAGFGTALAIEYLPEDLSVAIPSKHYLGPNGTSIEGVGVEPDIAVKDTNPYGYYVAGTYDAVLEKALEYLRNKPVQYAQSAR